MVYKYPDKNGNMIETLHLNNFIKGIDGAIKHGYGPGHNTAYQAPVSKKVSFAEAQKRLRDQTSTDFVTTPEDRKRAEFSAAVGREVARTLQAAGMGLQVQSPPATREGQAPAAKTQRRGLSWAEAQKKLKVDLGEDFLSESAPLAKSKSQGPRAVRRFHEPMPGCKLLPL
jgi:hypothetical protein